MECFQLALMKGIHIDVNFLLMDVIDCGIGEEHCNVTLLGGGVVGKGSACDLQ